jgi:hypothetical protein
VSAFDCLYSLSGNKPHKGTTFSSFGGNLFLKCGCKYPARSPRLSVCGIGDSPTAGCPFMRSLIAHGWAKESPNPVFRHLRIDLEFNSQSRGFFRKCHGALRRLQALDGMHRLRFAIPSDTHQEVAGNTLSLRREKRWSLGRGIIQKSPSCSSCSIERLRLRVVQRGCGCCDAPSLCASAYLDTRAFAV